MARPKEFDREAALDAAMEVFREHGFEGASAAMLVESMGIGRQSLYDTFGDKWQLYLAAVRRYASLETGSHLSVLRSESKAIDGLKAVVDRVVREARLSCLGVNSICEFGTRSPELSELQASADRTLRAAFVARIVEAQADGDVSGDQDPDALVDFLSASFAGIRVAARAGAEDARLKALGGLVMRALR